MLTYFIRSINAVGCNICVSLTLILRIECHNHAHLIFYHKTQIQANFPMKAHYGAFIGRWMGVSMCRYLVFTLIYDSAHYGTTLCGDVPTLWFMTDVGLANPDGRPTYLSLRRFNWPSRATIDPEVTVLMPSVVASVSWDKKGIYVLILSHRPTTTFGTHMVTHSHA